MFGEKISERQIQDSKKDLQNTYAAKKSNTQFEAKKVLNGKDLEAGQFEFEERNGHTVSNDANR